MHETRAALGAPHIGEIDDHAHALGCVAAETQVGLVVAVVAPDAVDHLIGLAPLISASVSAGADRFSRDLSEQRLQHTMRAPILASYRQRVLSGRPAISSSTLMAVLGTLCP